MFGGQCSNFKLCVRVLYITITATVRVPYITITATVRVPYITITATVVRLEPEKRGWLFRVTVYAR